MNELQIFNNDQYGAIRTASVNDEPWFIASDICNALDLSNPTVAVSRLDDDEKAKLNLGLSGGDTNCVNEFGLYNLVLASRKPEAKQFKRWITHEVIPAIRKDGGYISSSVNDTPEQIMARAVLVAQETIAKREQQIAELKNENSVLEPKAAFADSVRRSEDCILVRDYAKNLTQDGIKIGGNRLYSWLRENGYLINSRVSDWNMPTQRSAEMGLFRVIESTRSSPEGKVFIDRTVKITGKGQVYFHKKLKEVFQRKNKEVANG